MQADLHLHSIGVKPVADPEEGKRVMFPVPSKEGKEKYGGQSRRTDFMFDDPCKLSGPATALCLSHHRNDYLILTQDATENGTVLIKPYLNVYGNNFESNSSILSIYLILSFILNTFTVLFLTIVT